MKLLVLIKQIPDMSNMRLDASHRVVREGLDLVPNPFDTRAVALAARLREEHGATVTVVTMGPPQARAVLDFARAAAGAEHCIHVCDPALAGSDTLVTAAVLAKVAARVSADIIVTGQYSVDSETGQVPEQLAALLGMPCLPAVREFDYDSAARAVTVKCETDDGMETLRTALPVLVTTAERLMKPARATPEQLAEAEGLEVETQTIADLGLSPEEVGGEGSPTWVSGMQPMGTSRNPVRVDVEALGEAIDSVVLPGIGNGGGAPESQTAAGAAGRRVWVLLESASGRLSDASRALLGLARQLGGDVTGICLAGPDSQVDTNAAFECGAGRVVVGQNEHLEPYSGEAWSDALEYLLDSREEPDLIIASATRIGRATMSRVAAHRSLGLTGDCVGIEEDGDGALLHLKPAFGGNLIAPIGCRTKPELTTIVPGTIPPPVVAAAAGEAEIVQIDCPAPRVNVVETDRSAAALAEALDSARIVLCVANTPGDAQADLKLAEESRRRLEEATGVATALAATRRVTDTGLLPRQVQVGLTGRAIAPDIYIGLGVRGAAYHMVGIKNAKVVIALNSDPEATIFGDCDLAIEGRWQDLLPVLVDALAARLGKES
ncbi:MAG: FAD-binding protein [Alphaproteobacteria bacterium]